MYKPQAQIHTGFHRFTEIGHIFHNKYNFDNKNTSKVGIWPVSCLNDYEIQERRLEGMKIQKISWGSPSPDPSGSLRLCRSFRKSVGIYPRSAPEPGQGSVLGTLIKNKTIKFWWSGQELKFRALHYSTHETLLICKLKPSLNMQSDSVCAKVFV